MEITSVFGENCRYVIVYEFLGSLFISGLGKSRIPAPFINIDAIKVGLEIDAGFQQEMATS